MLTASAYDRPPTFPRILEIFRPVNLAAIALLTVFEFVRLPHHLGWTPLVTAGVLIDRDRGPRTKIAKATPFGYLVDRSPPPCPSSVEGDSNGPTALRGTDLAPFANAANYENGGWL